MHRRLSPKCSRRPNRRGKLDRQRWAAMSNGTREFWLIDGGRRRVEVYLLGAEMRVYGLEDSIPVKALNSARFPVRILFE